MLVVGVHSFDYGTPECHVNRIERAGGLACGTSEPIFLLGEPPPAIGGIRDDHAAQSNPPIFVDVRRKEA